MRWIGLALITLLLCTPASAQRGASAKDRLVGNWKLVSFETLSPTGEARPGTYDSGRLHYDRAGNMAAHLMRTPAAKTPAPATDQARSAAYRSYLGYYGPYTVDEKNQIVHHLVEGSSFPHWIGTDQVRGYSVSEDGQKLVLTVVSGPGATPSSRVTWQRLD